MYSDGNSFEQILDRTLSNELLSDVDKREGSIVYDTLAPVCMELADAYVKMDILESQLSLLTATGTNLDNRAYEQGMAREQATQAERIGTFKKYQVDEQTGEYVYSYTYVGENQGDYNYDSETQTYVYVGENQGSYVKGGKILIDMDIPEGSRFVSPENDSIIYEFIGKDDEDENILRCETYGSVGNEYTGTILPLTAIPDLVEAKITGTHIPAQDTESDDELRTRVINKLNSLSFGGNIDSYIEKVSSIDGVGTCKVFPAWQYNGSVLLSVVDSSYEPITQSFADRIKEEIDPEESSGQGVGFAPIGHYVTITTPIKSNVKVQFHLDLEAGVTPGNVQEECERKIEEYFNSVRHNFSQDNTLGIYRARIIDTIIEIPEVLNITDVLLNDVDADIVYTDEPFIDRQYLPYVSEVIID